MAIELPQYKNLSFDDVKAELIAYAKARSDFGSWKDFLDSSAGQTLLELMAGFATYLSFHSLAARRESYLESCRLYTSALGISNFLGYPANRKTAPKLTLLISSDATIYWEKTRPLCVYGDRNLVLLESTTLLAGPNIVDVVMGDWATFSEIVADTKDFNNIHVIDTGIDEIENERVKLTINGAPYPLTRHVEDLLGEQVERPIEIINMVTGTDTVLDTVDTAEDRTTGEAVKFNPTGGASLPAPLVVGDIYFIVMNAGPGKYRLATTLTNATAPTPVTIDITSVAGAGITEVIPVHLGITEGSLLTLIRTVYDGVVLMFGDEFFGKKIVNNDLVELQYIKTAGLLPVTEVLSTELSPRFAGTITEVTALDRGSNEDTLNKLKLVVPAYHSTKRRMVTREDHIAVFLGFVGDMISANARRKNPNEPPVCCTVEMAYLFPALPDTTQRTATVAEKAAMQAYLADFKMVGEQIEIIDPIRVTMTLKLTIVIFETPDVGSLISEIKQTIKEETQKLGEVFHIGQVLAKVAELDHIRRIYLHYPQNDRQLGWNEYIYFDEAFFDTNLVLTTTDPLITVSPSTAGYTPP